MILHNVARKRAMRVPCNLTGSYEHGKKRNTATIQIR